MPTTGGFIVGLTLAKEADVSKEEQASLALAGGLMPTPLLGALVVQGLIRRQRPVEKKSVSRSSA
jgi:6-phosphogluconolactonase/glucosamine-6-phosphate isomerase/deaminase